LISSGEIRRLKYVLAIDIGTTGVRAIVFQDAARACGLAYQELSTSFPAPGRAEQQPLDVLQATQSVVGSALHDAGIAVTDLAALGIVNQRSSIMAWDAKTLEPLSPMILWHDLRGEARSAELREQGYFVSATVSVTKAEWLMQNHEGVASAAREGRLCLGGPESFTLARLSGGSVHAIDHANASATGFYAPFDLAWEENLLALVGVAPSAMPTIVDSCGLIAETDSSQFGARVPIASMCGDQQAAMFGLGCVQHGATKCTYGTAAMVNTNTGSSLALGGAGTYPLVAWSREGKPVWTIEGNVTTAGAAIQWLRDGLAVVDDAAETSDLAESVSDSGGVWAVPAFQGLGTPFDETRARAAVGGLSRGSTRAHVVRAMLEGIAQRVTDVADAVWEPTGPADALRADGGASRNDFLLQLQADILGVPVERSSFSDGSALGAARLAGVAIGMLDEDDVGNDWNPDRVFEPRISADERASLRAAWKKRLELVSRDLVD
jgi:glycerol kinase